MLNVARFYASYKNATEILSALKSKEVAEEATGMRWEEMTDEEMDNWCGDTWYDEWRIAQHKAGIISRKYGVRYEDLIDTQRLSALEWALQFLVPVTASGLKADSFACAFN